MRLPAGRRSGRASSYFPTRKLPGEIVEDPQQVAIEIPGRELMQVPRLRLGLGDDVRAASAPALMQIVDFLLVVQIEPNQRRRGIAVLFSKGSVCQKDSAAAAGNLTDPTLIAAPVSAEAEAPLVVACG